MKRLFKDDDKRKGLKNWNRLKVGSQESNVSIGKQIQGSVATNSRTHRDHYDITLDRIRGQKDKVL